uniref:Putative secreted protein n=1 Tax=Anopheles marajoara TaxID=58244 RepID=A0A2M4C7G3_9DIPT
MENCFIVLLFNCAAFVCSRESQARILSWGTCLPACLPLGRCTSFHFYVSFTSRLCDPDIVPQAARQADGWTDGFVYTSRSIPGQWRNCFLSPFRTGQEKRIQNCRNTMRVRTFLAFSVAPVV